MFVRTVILLLVTYFTICNVFSHDILLSQFIFGNLSDCQQTCVLVVPDRAIVNHVNLKYVKNLTVNVRRASKRGLYVVNIQGIINVPMGNNMTVHVMLYEHSSKFNQYIKIFIEFHHKLCDMIRDDQIFGAVVRKIGVTQCPIQPGPISWNNLTLAKDLDFELPFEAGKAEFKLRSESANELILAADIIFHVQRKNRKS